VADSKVLLNGLIEYRASLERHLNQLRSEYQQVEQRWHIFSAVYEGDAADQFKAGWMRTASRFNEYIERTDAIARILDERIAFLSEANKQEGMSLG